MASDARREAGITHLEMIATAAIVMILASAILPLARVTRQRQREIELRRSLREVRHAIDEYKDAVDKGKIGGADIKLGSEGYPPDLDVLVEGVNQVGSAGKKLRFARIDVGNLHQGIQPRAVPARLDCRDLRGKFTSGCAVAFA